MPDIVEADRSRCERLPIFDSSPQSNIAYIHHIMLSAGHFDAISRRPVLLEDIACPPLAEPDVSDQSPLRAAADRRKFNTVHSGRHTDAASRTAPNGDAGIIVLNKELTCERSD
jgi:hypothetical protein